MAQKDSKTMKAVLHFDQSAKYPLAADFDPDFDQPHQYAKSNGDGSPRGYCRCGRKREDRMHISCDQ